MGAQQSKKRKPVSLALVPGYEGRYQEGRRDVPDPLEPGATIRATVNVKATTLEHMASRRRINTAQHAAGEKFMKLWRDAAIGRQKAIDYSQVSVDGGKLGDPITDNLIQATNQLNEAMAAVGMVGSGMLTAILGEEKGIAEYARAWSDDGGAVAGERAQGYVTGRFIEALDVLVSHWGMEAVGRPVSRESLIGKRLVTDTIRAERNLSITGPAYEAVANRFGEVTSVPMQPSRVPQRIYASGSAGRGGGQLKKAA